MKRNPSHTDPVIGDLFAIPRPAAAVDGTMDYRKPVSGLVSEMLDDARASGMDRYDVATRASRLSGRDISKATLDGYSSEARDEFNIPLAVVPVLETACHSSRLTEWLASVRGGRFLAGVDTLDAEIGRRTRELENASAELRQLRNLRSKVRG